VRGKSLTVALNGITRIKDEFGQIVEVTGVVDQSSARSGSRLAIVEAEIYGPLDEGK
jgi:hypothetical protein